MLIFAEKY